MFRVLLLALALVGWHRCADPQEIEAKRFEMVPGKAVIYLVRDLRILRMRGHNAGRQLMATTYPARFFRWVVDRAA